MISRDESADGIRETAPGPSPVAITESRIRGVTGNKRPLSKNRSMNLCFNHLILYLCFAPVDSRIQDSGLLPSDVVFSVWTCLSVQPASSPDFSDSLWRKFTMDAMKSDPLILFFPSFRYI